MHYHRQLVSPKETTNSQSATGLKAVPLAGPVYQFLRNFTAMICVWGVWEH